MLGHFRLGARGLLQLHQLFDAPLDHFHDLVPVFASQRQLLAFVLVLIVCFDLVVVSDFHLQK